MEKNWTKRSLKIWKISKRKRKRKSKMYQLALGVIHIRKIFHSIAPPNLIVTNPRVCGRHQTKHTLEGTMILRSRRKEVSPIRLLKSQNLHRHVGGYLQMNLTSMMGRRPPVLLLEVKSPWIPTHQIPKPKAMYGFLQIDRFSMMGQPQPEPPYRLTSKEVVMKPTMLLMIL